MTLKSKLWAAVAFHVFGEEIDRLGHDKWKFAYKVLLSEDEWKEIAKTLRKTGTWKGPIACHIRNGETNEKFNVEANVHLTRRGNYIEGNPVGNVRVNHAQ